MKGPTGAPSRARVSGARLGGDPYRAPRQATLSALGGISTPPSHRAGGTCLVRSLARANIGIVTGIVSRLVVLDIDPRHDGDDALILLQRKHGPLPHTVEALTGGGGRHVYFLHPGKPMHNKVGLVAGIDLRADGGLVVAPPSVHPSGRFYAWEHHPDATALAVMPLWLQSLVANDEAHPGHPMAHWRSLVQSGVPEGERNNTVASLTGHLLWHGSIPK